MRFTRVRDLVAAGVIAAVLVHVLVRVGYDLLPPLPVLAGTPLLVLAIVEALAGYNLRARIACHEGTRPVDALVAARAVALAKASSMVGALTVGAWVAVLVFVVPQAGQIAAAARDVLPAVIGVGCALSLVAAALWLEYCCQTPKRPRDERDGPTA